MKKRLYIETTVVSYYAGRATRDLLIQCPEICSPEELMEAEE